MAPLNPIKVRALRALWKTSPHLTLAQMGDHLSVTTQELLDAMFTPSFGEDKPPGLLRIPEVSATPAAQRECEVALLTLAAAQRYVPRSLIAEAIAKPVDVVDGVIAALRAGHAPGLIATTFSITSAKVMLIGRGIGWSREWQVEAEATKSRHCALIESLPVRQTPDLQRRCQDVLLKLRRGFAPAVDDIANAASLPPRLLHKILFSPEKGWTRQKLRDRFHLPTWQCIYITTVQRRYHDIPGAGAPDEDEMADD